MSLLSDSVRSHRAPSCMMECLESRLLLATYFVDGTLGNDIAHNGLSLNAPFRTIQRAANVAEAGDTVLIRGGVYRETVVPANSGSPGNPIVFKPYNNEQVILDGSDLITGTWTPYQGDIWKVQLPSTFNSAINQAEQLFADGEMMTWAQTPNAPADLMRLGAYTVDRVISKTSTLTPGLNPPSTLSNPNAGGGLRVTFESSQLTAPASAWADGGSIWVLTRYNPGSTGGGWGFAASGPIISYQPGRITVDLPIDDGTQYAQSSVEVGVPFYLMGNFNALDAQREWFRDPATNTLYFWAPGGADPNTMEVKIKRRDYAFNLDSRSHITIEDLHLFAATITTDNQAGPGTGGGKWAGWGRPNGSVASASNITLDGLRVKYPSHFVNQTGNKDIQWSANTGVILSGTDHVLRNSIISHSAGNGVSVLGLRHTIDNNIIHDVNYQVTAGAGIYTRNNVYDTRITNNTIYNSTNSGIELVRFSSTDSSNPAVVAHNRISNVGLHTWDVGAIRTIGLQGNGTVIRNNVISDSTSRLSFGIYLDFVAGFNVHHNVVYNTRAAMVSWTHSSGGNHIVNNTFIGSTDSLQGSGFGSSSIIRNNILVGKINLPQGVTLGPNASHNINAMVGFIDPQQGDFRLSTGSTAINAGTNVAPYTNAVTDGQPDVGAFEFGAAAWQAGSTLTRPIDTPLNVRATWAGSGRDVRLSWENTANLPVVIERATVGQVIGEILWSVETTRPAGTTTWVHSAPPRIDGLYRVRYVGAAPSQTVSATIANHGIASASSGAGADQWGTGPENAFDSTQNTHWRTNEGQPTGWLQYRFNPGQRQIVTGYTLISPSGNMATFPTAWQLLGSNDGSNWTLLDTRTGQSFPWTVRPLSYSITNTVPYEYYRLNITANAGGNRVGLSEFMLHAATPAPGAPTALSAAGVAGGVELSWTNNATTHSGFVIERAANAAFTQDLTTLTAPASSTTVVDATAVPGGTYFYRVRATNAGGWSAPSNVRQVTLAGDGVNVTVGGTASASSATSTQPASQAFDGLITHTWRSTSVPAWLQYQFGNGAAQIVTSYSITNAANNLARDPRNWSLQGSNDGVNWTTLNTQTNQTFGAFNTTRTFAFANTTAYSQYRLDITASNGDPSTQIAELELYATKFAPSAPSNLTAQAVSAFAIDLVWSNTDPYQTAVRVERATNSAFTQNLATFTLSASAQTFSDTHLNPATTYFYRVRAVNEGGWSGATPTASATTNSPAAMVNVAAGGTASASSSNAAHEGPIRAFDGNDATKWMSSAVPAWLQYQFASGISHAVQGYAITSASDVPERDPRNWTLQASHDGVNWVTIDSRANETFSGRRVTNTYYFENADAYSHYRLNITHTRNNWSTTQLAELQLLAVPAPAPQITSFAINDGHVQRSMVNSMTYTFSSAVSIQAGAFTLVSRGDGLNIPVTATSQSGGQVYVLSFSGSGIVGGSLPDGRYDLTLDRTRVTDAYGQMPPASDLRSFHRLLGDANGDGRVDMADNRLFTASLFSTAGSSAYRWYFDFNADGRIDMADNRLFTSRLFVQLSV